MVDDFVDSITEVLALWEVHEESYGIFRVFSDTIASGIARTGKIAVSNIPHGGDRHYVR